MLEKPVSVFLEKAASRSPAPGGGCAAALAGALGAAMASMSLNFTLGKKGYEDVREEAESLLSVSESARLKLAELAEKDITSYEKVSAAFRMPAEDDSQKKARQAAVREALLDALETPFETASRCMEAMRILPRLSRIGNKNLISDVGVAACLLKAAVESAALNVEINIRAISDPELTDPKKRVLEEWLSECGKISESVMPPVMKGIRG